MSGLDVCICILAFDETPVDCIATLPPSAIIE